MDEDEVERLAQNGQVEVVDPALRAHIYSLVSAIGGSSAEEDGKYVIGDDALACLKDLKRWLKGYDEKLGRLDVARCMFEANLVAGDLLEILALWSPAENENKTKYKLALASLELLVPLTWPLDKPDDAMTVNHHRHIPVLQHAQIIYKQSILQHRSSTILEAFVRIALPSMAVPLRERTTRDEGIVKLVLYLLRDISKLDSNGAHDEDTGETISRNTTILEYHRQGVLYLLLTLASGMGDAFDSQDMILLENIFYLVRGVKAETLFMAGDQYNSNQTENLTNLLKLEDGMRKLNAKTASTRHNRFGTTVWVKREDGRQSVISGQDALLREKGTLLKMDMSKKWHKPQYRGKETGPVNESERAIFLHETSRQYLREFVEEFLDAGFNPLFSHVRKALERDSERVLTDTHPKQFFQLCAWFLQADRARRKMDPKRSSSKGTEGSVFGLVASILNQETFIVLNRFMRESFEAKSWRQLQSGCQCLTQILLTVQDMATSALEDDQEVAENIQNRIFYEETTQDMIISILRAYTNQSLPYLDSVTHLVHVHLKMLEQYAKQNTNMVVRSKNRRRKKVQNALENEQTTAASDDEEVEVASRRTVAERQFDFARFESKYLNQGCVDSIVAFLRNYKELDNLQIKRAISFLHRVFVKKEMEILLFRVDILQLFYTMMDDTMTISKGHPAYKELDQFVRHVVKKLTRKLREIPALYVEMLFSKIPKTYYYLQNGFELEAFKSQPRAPAEWEIYSNIKESDVDHIGILVTVLVNEEKSETLEWLKNIFSTIIAERWAWELEGAARRELVNAEADSGDVMPESLVEAPPIALQPDSEERKLSIFTDGKLRLLLSLLGFRREGAQDLVHTLWYISPHLTAENLRERLEKLKTYTEQPLHFKDGTDVAKHIRRKPKPKFEKVLHSSDDGGDTEDDDIDISDDDNLLLAANNDPTAKLVNVKPIKKRKRTSMTKRPTKTSIDEAELAERLKRKHLRDLEKAQRIKSAMLISPSDDESDEERDRLFFEKEATLRQAMENASLLGMNLFTKPSSKAINKRRKVASATASRNLSLPKGDSDESSDAAVLQVVTSPSSEQSQTFSRFASRRKQRRAIVPLSQSVTVMDEGLETDDSRQSDADLKDGRSILSNPRRGRLVVESESE